MEITPKAMRDPNKPFRRISSQFGPTKFMSPQAPQMFGATQSPGPQSCLQTGVAQFLPSQPSEMHPVWQFPVSLLQPATAQFPQTFLQSEPHLPTGHASVVALFWATAKVANKANTEIEIISFMVSLG